MKILELFIQIGIMTFGCLSIWFVTREEDWKRWGYIFGVLSQPFWIYETTTKEQWGILAMTLFYAYSWSQGVWNFWIKPKLKK